MPLENITYNKIITEVATVIKNKCHNTNATTYNNIPDILKSQKNVDLTFGSYAATLRITSNGPFIENKTSVSIENIETKIKNFPVNNKTIETAYNLSSNIGMPEFISFYNNIVSYCCKNLVYISGAISKKNSTSVDVLPNSYLTFLDTSSANDAFDIMPDDLIYAKSATDVIKVLKETINKHIRHEEEKYTYSNV